MIINLILLTVFIISFFVVWYRISQGIPKLAMVSDETITTYFREESSKLHFFIVEIKSFYRDKKYKEWLRGLGAKILYRLHILLLKSDNKITSVLKNLRAIDTKTSELKSEDISAPPITTRLVERHPRIQEVRIRKRKNKPSLSNSLE